MLGKFISGFVGARVADEVGRSGVLGAAVGVIASRVITRSPLGAATVGGVWIAHKLWKRKKERDERREELAALNAKPVGPAVTEAPVQPSTTTFDADPLGSVAQGGTRL